MHDSLVDTTSSTAPLIRNRSAAARWMMRCVLCLLLLAATVWGGNYLLIGRPVARELSSDPRNAGFVLKPHYQYYIEPRTLVLDLRSVTRAAPVDLFRAVFQSAKALHHGGRVFTKVVLARSGQAVFVMQGPTFAEVGAEFAAGQNPVYMIRTFPEKLLLPDGTAAFPRWTGGWLGVMSKQMDNANEVARRWGQGD